MVDKESKFRITVDSSQAEGALGRLTEKEKKLGEATGFTAKSFSDLENKYNRAEGITEYARKVEALDKSYRQGAISSKQLSQELSFLQKKFQEAGGSTAGFGQAVEQAQKKVVAAADALKKKTDALKASADASKAAAESNNFLQNKLVQLTSATFLAEKGFQVLKGAVTGVFSSLDEAARIEGLNRGFESLQTAAGNVADEFLGKLRTATHGYISDVDLMKSANQAVLLGLPTEGFDQLAGAAVKLGQAMGITATQAIDSLTIGIGRQSKLVLDNLGIIVEAEKAYDRYAKRLGVTAEALTDVQKKEAFYQAAQEAILAKSSQLSDVQETAASATTKLSATFDNLRKSALETLSAQTGLTDAINGFNDVVKQTDLNPLIVALAKIAELTTLSITGFTATGNAILYLGKQVRAGNDPFGTALLENAQKAGEGYYFIAKKISEAQLGLGSSKIKSEARDVQISLEAIKGELLKLPTGGDEGIKSLKDSLLGQLKAIESQSDVLKVKLPESLVKAGAAAEATAEKIKELGGKIQSLFNAQKDKTLLPDEYQKGLAALRTEYEKAGVSAQRFDQLLKNAGAKDGLKAQKDAANEAKKALKEHEDALKKNEDAQKKFADQVQKVTQGSKEYKDILAKIKTGELDNATGAQKLGDLVKENTDLVSTYNTNLAVLDSLYKSIATGQPIDPAKLAAAAAAVEDFEKKVAGAKGKSKQSPIGAIFGDGFLGDLFGNKTDDKTGSDFGRGIGEKIGADILSGLEAAVSGGDFRSAIAQVGATAGAAVGESLGGPLGAALGKIAGEKYGEAISNIGKTTAGSVKGIAALSTGGLAAFIPDSFFDGIFGDSAKTKARKAADKFFAEVLDANNLSVIIGGQIQQISDLVFSGNQEGGIFAGLDQATQDAFTGIGAAFEGLLGIGEDVSANLGAVFANNLGGDLNNLQLLVQATGKSFDELSQKIIFAFFEGEKSIIETAEALQRLNGIMTKGIPGAVGAVGKAFDNMGAAGSKGGRALLDAIADIGAEAQELGLKDLPSLRNVLINTFGKSTQEVQIFFEAMRVAGIKSIADLANASQAMLVAVAGNVAVATAGGTPTFSEVNVSDPAIDRTPPSSGGSKPKKEKKKADILISLLPELSRVAVRGIDDVIAEFAKLEEASGSAFGSDLLKNFKGDLNELQVVANALGESFEAMAKKTVDSFKAGQTSALEAANALKQTGQGIPDVIGGIADAVRDIQKFGTKGGSFSIDSLRDLGAEATEAGIKGIDKDQRDKLARQRVETRFSGQSVTADVLNAALKQASEEIDAENNPFAVLQKKLAEQGIDDGSIKRIFDAFTANGIDSIEKITSLSDATGVKILGSLQEAGFAFAETDQKLTQLLDSVDKINREQEMTIKLNIKNGDVQFDAKEIAKQIQAQFPGIKFNIEAGLVTRGQGRGNTVGDEIRRDRRGKPQPPPGK